MTAQTAKRRRYLRVQRQRLAAQDRRSPVREARSPVSTPTPPSAGLLGVIRRMMGKFRRGEHIDARAK